MRELQVTFVLVLKKLCVYDQKPCCFHCGVVGGGSNFPLMPYTAIPVNTTGCGASGMGPLGELFIAQLGGYETARIVALSVLGSRIYV